MDRLIEGMIRIGVEDNERPDRPPAVPKPPLGPRKTFCVWCGKAMLPHEVNMVPWPDEANAKPVCARCCDDSA